MPYIHKSIEIRTPRLIVGGTHSGVGKTLISCLLARLFRDLGLRVRMFKCGPDYIDPSYHECASGQMSLNLDHWMLGQDCLIESFAAACEGFDLAIIEGVMGLYDGVSADSNHGSAASLAELLDASILLVGDASGMARSFAALVHGFQTFAEQPERLIAVIANRVGSAGHLQLLKRALSDHPDLIIGGLCKQKTPAIPSRHLGLQWPEETNFDSQLQQGTEELAKLFSVEHLWQRLQQQSPLRQSLDFFRPSPVVPPSKPLKIGLMKDEVFRFYYPEQSQLLEELGAQIQLISSIEDNSLDDDIDGLIIPGGYPELFASELAANQSMLRSIQLAAKRGLPIYAECGGLIYLSQRLCLPSGTSFPMAGVLPLKITLRESLQALGYAEIVTDAPSIIGEAGMRFRCHQFRYSSYELLDSEPLAQIYKIKRRRSETEELEGFQPCDNVLATYYHTNWSANPSLASHFLQSCRRFRQKRPLASLDHEPATSRMQIP